MKVLVTGASGFVGNYVVEELLRQFHEIIIAGRSLPEKWQTNSQISFCPFDLEQLNTDTNYYNYFDKPDCLIHLAWQGLPNYTQLFHFEHNLFSHYRFLKNIITNGLTALTVTGTCFEYGMQQGELAEDMPALPDNAYALAKHTLYLFLKEFKKHSAFNLCWLRLFYMYGQGQSANSLYSQLTEALERRSETFNMSGGEQVRDFLPVEKVAEIITHIALQKLDANIVNCCSGQPIKVRDWVMDFLGKRDQQIQLNLGYYPYAVYEPMEFWGSTEKMNKCLRMNDVNI